MPVILGEDTLINTLGHANASEGRPLEIIIKEIDPLRCKPWKFHNRDSAWLTKERCHELINSIQKDGQNVPALVRELKDDPNHDYELIYGVRRWFACLQIPNQKLLAQISDIDDKTCMILMHAENAYSKDISEFERAFSFAQQMKSGVFKNQSEMAEAMGLSQGTISKMIRAAEILEFHWVRDLFQHKLDIPVKYAYLLSALLKDPYNFELIKKEAEVIKLERARSGQYIAATIVLKRLINHSKSELQVNDDSVILTSNDKAVISCRRDKFGKVSIFIDDKAKTLNRSEVEAACLKAIGDYVFGLFPGE